MSNDSPIIKCVGLTKVFAEGSLHVEVFKDIDFVLSAGDMVAITGASGSGKSTFLHLLGGLDTPTSGYVELMGERFSTSRGIRSIKEAKKSAMRNSHLGFVYQFHHLLPEFSALENVCMPLWIRKESQLKSKEKALSLIEQVGLKDRANHRIGELSGGERQRIAIARALVTNPSCVLADEPTGNLDSESASHILELMLHLNQEMGVSFIAVTHSHEFAGKLNKQYVINKGELVLPAEVK
jgi:lipoprotein-releasing system ATP-binding protein